MLKTICFNLILAASIATAQDRPVEPPEQWGLEELTEYLGLKPGDISFRPDYTEPDSFRLEVAANLMQQPLGMVEYLDSLKNGHINGQPEILAGYLFKQLALAGKVGRSSAYKPDGAEMRATYNLYYNDVALNQLMTRAAAYIDVIFPKSVDKSLAFLSRDQKAFLTKQFKHLLEMREEDEFLSVDQLDSLEKLDEAYTKQFVEFGYKIDKDPILDAGINCLRELTQEIGALRQEIRSGQTTANKIVEGLGFVPNGADLNSYLGKQPGWKVGGPGNDYYSGDYKFILDLGGDDVYDLSYNPDSPHGVIIIDLGGNDSYRSQSDFTLGSGCLSVGFLLDFGGDDFYDAKSFGLGSGYFGMGVLYDAAGDDIYNGDYHVEGAGTFGIGQLIDEGGRDLYNAAAYAEGFGFTEGAGVIYDLAGSDSYYAGGKYKDILRYEDHYLSMSQGFGYGLRPYMSGGIGAIIDLKGDDTYYSDIFAQAASYWWSLGMIYDSSGNDNYQSFQYAQGAATHMTLGLLVDDYGNDVYSGKGLMQGCGHDYSCGMILDRHGDDTYTCFDLSQGAGSANGAGVLIDNEGNDRYFSRNALNTQGYGNPRRDFGSIGLFIDLGGEDQYLGNGKNNFYWRTDSKWGGGMDVELNQPDSVSGGSVK